MFSYIICFPRIVDPGFFFTVESGFRSHSDPDPHLDFIQIITKFNVNIYIKHRLRPIDTHLALYAMLYTNSAKNKYAELVHDKTMKIFKIRD